MADKNSGDTNAGFEDDKSENNSDDSRKKKNEKKETPALEWITAGIGLILVVGAIGFMLFDAFYSKDLPPDLIVAKEKTEQVKTGYLVTFKVKNNGDQTASTVVVEGSLNGESDETAQVTLDYVPPHSEREGGLYFSTKPDDSKLKLEAKGYEKP